MMNPLLTLETVLSSVRAANMQLVRLATARRTGTAEPAELSERARQYAQRMDEALQGGMPLTMEVESDIIRFGETKVIGEDLLSTYLCRALFDEGVRALFVEPGASLSELEKLAWLLSEDWGSRAIFEADLQASAWQNRFTAIHIDAIAGRIDIEDDDGEEVISQLLYQLGGDELSDGAVLPPVLRRLQALENAGPPRSAYIDESNCAVEHPQAFERFCRRLEAVRDEVDVSNDWISRLLFETIRTDTEPGSVNDLGVALIDQIVRSLASGQPECASALLHWPVMLLEEDVAPGWSLRWALSNALCGLNEPPLWEAIASGAANAVDLEAWRGPLFSLTVAMPAADVNEIIQAAAGLPDRLLRQAVADGAAVLCRRAGIAPLSLLQAATPAALKVALLAAARSQDATLVGPLLRHATSPDADTREAALIALRRQQSPRIKEVVRAALSDATSGVRMEAMRYVAVYRDRLGAERIQSLLQVHEPGTRTEAELRAMIRAMAHVMGEDAPVHLRALALQPSLAEKPALASAILGGLNSSGPAGQRALEEVGMIRPELRPQIRALHGGDG